MAAGHNRCQTHLRKAGAVMLFVSKEDFFSKVSSLRKMTREEERECARRMQSGDQSAREQLIQSYLPLVAAHIKRQPEHLQCLGLVIYCVHATAKAVDSFNFLQDSETFTHRLSWYLRNAVAAYHVK